MVVNVVFSSYRWRASYALFVSTSTSAAPTEATRVVLVPPSAPQMAEEPVGRKHFQSIFISKATLSTPSGCNILKVPHCCAVPCPTTRSCPWNTLKQRINKKHMLTSWHFLVDLIPEVLYSKCTQVESKITREISLSTCTELTVDPH